MQAEWDAYAAATPLMRLDDEELARALRDAGFLDVEVELDPGETRWQVDERTADVRLDAIEAAGELSLRQRWQAAFAPDEVERLVGHLKGLAGTTLTLLRPVAWARARKA